MKRFVKTKSHEPQYSELQQPECIYDIARVAEQTAFDGTLINTEAQYMELNQSEGVYDTVRVSEREVSCRYLVRLLCKIL